MVALLNSMKLFNTFNVVGIHEYQEHEDLYQEENPWLSSSKVEETDV